jgi:hypothetical protein
MICKAVMVARSLLVFMMMVRELPVSPLNRK